MDILEGTSLAPSEAVLEALVSFLQLKDMEEVYTMKPLSKEEAKYVEEHYPVYLQYDEVRSHLQKENSPFRTPRKPSCTIVPETCTTIS